MSSIHSFSLVLTRLQEQTHHNKFENQAFLVCASGGGGVVFCAECDLALSFKMLSGLNACLPDRQGLFIYGISFGTFPSMRTRLHAMNKLKTPYLSRSS